MVKLRRMVESTLYLESQKDLDDLKDYLGEDLFDDYLYIRNRLPSISVFKKTYPDYEEESDLDLSELAKKYNTLRKSPIVHGMRDIDNYPSSISKVDSENLKKTLTDYTFIRDFALNKIEDYKDFQRLKKIPLKDVEDFLSNFQTSSTKRNISKSQGAQKIYSDSDWDVYRITTYPASKLYGSGTKWCITGRYPGHEGRGEEYFYGYIRDYNLDGGYYFYLSKKDPSEKYCVLQTKDKKIHSIWDASDTNRGTVDMGIDLPIIPEVNLVKPESVKLGGFRWTKIGELNGHSLYLCNKVVKKMTFNKSDASNDWKDSDIRKWLNTDFYNILSPEEKSQIVPYNGDKLFLLSKDEYKKFKGNIYKIDEEWWLRSSGHYSSEADIVSEGLVYSYLVYTERIGVRPAILLKD